MISGTGEIHFFQPWRNLWIAWLVFSRYEVKIRIPIQKKSSHIRCDYSSSRQLESTLFNTSLGVTAAVTGKLIIWKIYDHIGEFSVAESTKDLFVSGIFGPLACSFLIASALQEPSSESRQFWSQTWKKLLSQKVFKKYLCLSVLVQLSLFSVDLPLSGT